MANKPTTVRGTAMDGYQPLAKGYQPGAKVIRPIEVGAGHQPTTGAGKPAGPPPNQGSGAKPAK